MNLMLKPVGGRCNLDCSYCFYKKGHTCNHPISAEDSCAIFEKMLPYLRAGAPLVFQGGEPLLAGYDYFAYVLEYLRSRNACFNVSVQTNGTLLNDKFAKLFYDNRVLVGVSLDGDRETHNHARGDFDDVMRGIDCLRRAGCEFNILTVVTNELAESIDRVYEFYRREKFEYQQYIPCMNPHGEALGSRLDNTSYEKFLLRLFELWENDLHTGRYVYIRLFENLMLLLSGQQAEDCGDMGVCTPQCLIDADGEVYPCDFYVFEDYRCGNLLRDTSDNVMRHISSSRFIEESRALPDDCLECRFLERCRNGCKRYRGDDGKYVYCQAYTSFLSKATPGFVRILREHGMLP